MEKKPKLQFLNSVELVGRVGNARVSTVAERKTVVLSVATNYAYRTGDGCPVIETQWTLVRAWLDGDATVPAKGDAVRVKGRLKSVRYVTADGQDRDSTEVYASSLEIIGGAAETIEDQQ